MEKCLTPAGESRDDMIDKWNANVEVLETEFIKSNDTVTIEVIDLQMPELSSIRILPAGAVSVGITKTECL